MPRVLVVEVSPSDPVGRLGDWLAEAAVASLALSAPTIICLL